MTADEIIAKMSQEGLRITEQRKTLAALFANASGYVTPKDVYDYMGKRYSGLSFDTVYRNLRLLHDMGVLEQFVFEDGVKFKTHCNEHHHHHHIICLSCDTTMPVAFCPMEAEVEVPNGFKVVRHKFELYGYCESCQGETAAK